MHRRVNVITVQGNEIRRASRKLCSVECGQLPGAVRAANFSTL